MMVTGACEAMRGLVEAHQIELESVTYELERSVQ